MAEHREVDTPEEIAEVVCRAFLNRVVDQFGQPPCARVTWNDMTMAERFTAMRTAARELGYSA
jgi:hypothetical protein